MSKRQMLINYVPGEECRIAIVEEGRLEEFYQERTSNESHVGNIYKGKVCNVEPSIQAAFIEFGLERNGFLHISDLHPMYFPGEYKEETEQVGLKTPRRDRPPIQKCLRRGQEILVQVLKEGIGTKGPTLTSYLSIPGRYLVMMPHMERLGVSRKVEDDEARRLSRDILNDLKPPAGFGFIIRTAGIGRTKTDLKRDLAYLQRLWKNIERRMKEVRIGELFAESDLVIRTIRDIYSSDIDRIIVDDDTAARRARDFLAISNPRSGSNVLVYRDPIPIFHRYDVERQIETINAKIVPLESGGSLVIESTEALVAIDVNSGKNRDSRDAEMTAFKTNLEATDEICRQLRLRDLGGVVVNDLIDMRNLTHRREIEQRFRENLKRDRARTRTLPISQFGILEMTRQRMRPSLKKSIYTDCPSCAGAGLVKSPESVVLDVMRRLALVMHRQQVARLELTVSPDVAFQLLNRKRSQLVGIEQAHGKPVTVRVNGAAGIDFVSLAAFDVRGGVVDAEVAEDLGEPKLEVAEEMSGMDEPLEVYEDETAEDSGETDAGKEAVVAVEISRAAGEDAGLKPPTFEPVAAAIDVAQGGQHGRARLALPSPRLPEHATVKARVDRARWALEASRVKAAGVGGGGAAGGAGARKGAGPIVRRGPGAPGGDFPSATQGQPMPASEGGVQDQSPDDDDDLPQEDESSGMTMDAGPVRLEVETPAPWAAEEPPESPEPPESQESPGNTRENDAPAVTPGNGGVGGAAGGGAAVPGKRRRRRRGGRGRRGRGKQGGGSVAADGQAGTINPNSGGQSSGGGAPADNGGSPGNFVARPAPPSAAPIPVPPPAPVKPKVGRGYSNRRGNDGQGKPPAQDRKAP